MLALRCGFLSNHLPSWAASLPGVICGPRGSPHNGLSRAFWGVLGHPLAQPGARRGASGGPEHPSPTAALTPTSFPEALAGAEIGFCKPAKHLVFSAPGRRTKLLFLPTALPGAYGRHREQTSRSHVQMSRCFCTEHSQAPTLPDPRQTGQLCSHRSTGPELLQAPQTTPRRVASPLSGACPLAWPSSAHTASMPGKTVLETRENERLMGQRGSCPPPKSSLGASCRQDWRAHRSQSPQEHHRVSLSLLPLDASPGPSSDFVSGLALSLSQLPSAHASIHCTWNSKPTPTFLPSPTPLPLCAGVRPSSPCTASQVQLIHHLLQETFPSAHLKCLPYPSLVPLIVPPPSPRALRFEYAA